MPTLLSSIFALPASNLSMLMLLAKATIILIAALGITLAMQRASAGARHLVWLVTLGTLLLVPAIAAWAPIRLAVLPAAPAVAAVPVANSTAAQAPATSAPKASAPVSINTSASIGASDNSGIAESNGGVVSRLEGLSGIEAVLAIWAAIVVALAAWLAYGALAVRGIVRRALPLDSQDWLAPLYEVSDRLSLDEAPRLLRSEDAKMPFACGVIHPTIVLPAECDNWTPDRRLAVLLHELAHVRRHDLIGHTLGRIACAFYWFHPLVWTAAKQLRSESERACDDLALACGARPSDYAEHLLDIVTSVRHDSTPVVALAMARRKEFEGRMLAILDPELRHSSPSRWQSASLIGSLALIAILVGAAAPAQREQIKTTPVTESNTSDSAPVELALAPKSDQIITQGDHALDAKTKPEPKYPNSGVRGIASTAERMIQQMTQSTQVHTQTSMQVQTQTVTSPGSEKGADAAADKADKIAEMLRNRGARVTVQGKADDRPLLLANVLKTDTSASLRRIAAWGLAEYAETQIATDALAYALLHDSNAGVREMAAWALGNGDGDSSAAVEALTSALRRDSNSRVRATAIWALGDIGDKGSIDVVTAALSDTSSGIRFRAIWALGQIGPREAPKALVAMLRDADPRVREITAWALYEIEDPGAVPALDAALRAESDKNLQVAYIRALAATGEKSVDAVRRLLQSNDPQIRSMAVRALAGGNAAGPWPWPWPEPRPQP